MNGPLSPYCPYYHRAMTAFGRRWTPEIARALLSGATRFGQIREIIPGLSDRLLSERLKELEAEGIVARTVAPETPVRIEYRLTPKGIALGDVIRSIAAWAEEWITPEEAARAPARRPD